VFWGGAGGGGRRRVVSLLFRGPPDTRRGAPGSAAWQAQRSRTFMYTYLYMCMRVYTCVHACIHVHVNTSVCRGGSAVHATPPRAPSAPSAVRVWRAGSRLLVSNTIRSSSQKSSMCDFIYRKYTRALTVWEFFCVQECFDPASLAGTIFRKVLYIVILHRNILGHWLENFVQPRAPPCRGSPQIY
jgi:hypothetical protein